MRFPNRVKAGRSLGEKLRAEALVDPVVVALPRGGVPVGAAVAEALRAPLEVLAVRKLGAPLNPEFGFGALAEGGAMHLDAESVRRLGLASDEIEHVAQEAQREVERRAQLYRRGGPLVDLHGRTAVLVDDGIATGNTVLAAISALRSAGAARLVLAVPVLPAEAVDAFTLQVDLLVYLRSPERFVSVGSWYDEFPQVSDDEVLAILERARGRRRPELELQSLAIPLEGDAIGADLAVPPGARGLVVFAHGSGSSRQSPRNRYVARRLQQAGLATLLVDLLTEREEAEDAVTGRLRFGVELLAHRLEIARAWVRRQPALASLPVGYFGASTGAAAALISVAEDPDGVRAVVSRGGRPDLAASHLADVHVPTLFIVGGRDPDVLELNREARARMRCPTQLEVVPGATHLFEEPGALTAVADLAAAWFDHHLTRRAEDAARPEA